MCWFFNDLVQSILFCYSFVFNGFNLESITAHSVFITFINAEVAGIDKRSSCFLKDDA